MHIYNFSSKEKCRKITLMGNVKCLMHFLNEFLSVQLICNIELFKANCTNTLNKEIIFGTQPQAEKVTRLKKIAFCGAYVFTPTLIRLKALPGSINVRQKKKDLTTFRSKSIAVLSHLSK